MDNAIEFNNVYKSYAEHTVLHSASLVVPNVGISVIYGPSGIGKSTVLSLIAGFESVDRGEILLRGLCVSRKGLQLPPSGRNISMQFQSLALWPHMNATEHITFVSNSVRKNRINEITAQVGFPKEKLTKYPYQLSGGERQRLALARTIAADTDIMLFDEPFNNLDEDLYVRVAKTFNELSSKKAILIVQHDTKVLSDYTEVKRWYEMKSNGLLNELSLVDPHANIA